MQSQSLVCLPHGCARCPVNSAKNLTQYASAGIAKVVHVHRGMKEGHTLQCQAGLAELVYQRHRCSLELVQCLLHGGLEAVPVSSTRRGFDDATRLLQACAAFKGQSSHLVSGARCCATHSGLGMLRHACTDMHSLRQCDSSEQCCPLC
jgi:hypothetical protein